MRRGAGIGGPPKRPPVTSLIGEPLLVFIVTEQPVLTGDVAGRFGWSMKRAQRELWALREEGLIVSQRDGRTMRWRRRR